ncbi:MAG: hypothetical protein AAGI71_12745 [Bacteroidota bacterium]
MESLPQSPTADDLIEQMLRDQDFLLAKEIKHKVAELNQLFVRAHGRTLKVEMNAKSMEVGETSLAFLDVRVFKQM